MTFNSRELKAVDKAFEELEHAFHAYGAQSKEHLKALAKYELLAYGKILEGESNQ